MLQLALGTCSRPSDERYRDTVTAEFTIPSPGFCGRVPGAAGEAGRTNLEGAALVKELSIYRNEAGERFFRTAPTAGRTGSFRVEAESVAALERWLRANGYRPVSLPQTRAA
jgi:hypothetical protein